MRVLTFDSIVRRPMGWFDFPEHSTGELTTRLATDAELVSNISGRQLGYRIRMFSSMITGIVIALIYSWQIGLVAIACIPTMMGAATIQAIFLAKRFVLEYEGLSPATILEQGLRGIAAVQAYNHLQTKVGEDHAESLKPESAGKIGLWLFSVFDFRFVRACLLCWFAAVGRWESRFCEFLPTRLKCNVWGSRRSAGMSTLVSCFPRSTYFFPPYIFVVLEPAIMNQQVNADFKSRQNGQAAAARIFAIVDEPLDSTDPFSDKGEKPSSLDGAIEFETCYFHYPTRPKNPIYYKSEEVDGFSLAISSKESVAFVGKSGCGKSTAEQLVLRFYDVSSGTVSLDGHKVEDLNIMWLREQIGYVGQQPVHVLFSGTVCSNILLGKPDATEEELSRQQRLQMHTSLS